MAAEGLSPVANNQDPWAAFVQQPAAQAAPGASDAWAAFNPTQPQDASLGPDNLARSFTHGIPIVGGLADKFAAGMDALTQPVLGRGSSAPSVGERYHQNVANEQAHTGAFEAAHPYSDTAAQLTGGVTSMLPVEAAAPFAFGARGTNLTTRALASGATNAGIGAADAEIRGNDPAVGAAIGGVGGVAAPIVGQVVGGVVGKLGGTGGPSMDQLFKSGATHYANARAAGVQFDPAALNTLATQLGTSLTSRGLLPENASVAPVFAALKRLQANGNPATRSLDDLQTVYMGLGKMGKSPDPVTREAAFHALNGIDSFYQNLPAGAVVAGNGALAAQELAAGSQDWGAARRAERINNAEDRGAMNAATAGTGANKENAQRQQFKSLAFKQGTGFSPEEQDAVRDVAAGDPLGNLLRYAGKFAPSGPVSAAAGAGLAHFATGADTFSPETALFAGGAYGAKKASEMISARRAQVADEMVRRRSALGRTYAPGSIAETLDRLATLGAARGSAQAGDTLINAPPYNTP